MGSGAHEQSQTEFARPPSRGTMGPDCVLEYELVDEWGGYDGDDGNSGLEVGDNKRQTRGKPL